MYDKILIPLDGTPESEDVLAEAQRMAAPNAEIYLLHVIPNVTPSTSLPTASLLSLPAQAEAYLDSVASRLSGVRQRMFVDAGDPAERIVKIALALSVGMIAMTTHARKGVTRVMLGSVAQKVVRGSKLPVLLVRPGMARPSRELRRFLVPLDGSERAARILDVVLPLAVRTRGEVILLHAMPAEADPMAGILPDKPIRLAAHDIRQHYRQIADSIENAGVAARSVIVRGEAVEEILREADALDVDLIAMTTHGRRGLARVIAGSITEGVLRKASHPVLVLYAAGAAKLQESRKAH